jgi:hypothetical protein
MPEANKARSPFHPGQPVPVELFVGRRPQIERIMQRGAGQAAAGKPVAVFVVGEYGIGKSSLARFVQRLAEKQHALHGIYAQLGACSRLEDVAAAIVQGVLISGAFDPRRDEKILNWLARYVGRQELLGVSFNLEALRQDAPGLASPEGLLPFLAEARKRLAEEGVRGLFLVLDEINGMTDQPQFAHFIKGLVDANALSRDPLPLLLMLCGVEERRRQMIQAHQPVERIFDVVEIEAMDETESREFFERSFSSVDMKLEAKAAQTMAHYSGGYPKVMHLVGDCAFWFDDDGVINESDAAAAVYMAAEEVGRKYVDQQVYGALRSEDYHSILSKIAGHGPDELSFAKKEVASGLSEAEKRKFDNFLQKMKRLKVIRSRDRLGEYVFNNRMVRLYIWLRSAKKEGGSAWDEPGNRRARPAEHHRR